MLILIHPSCYAHIMCLHRLLHYGPYSTDESISINSYQNGVSNPTTVGGLDVDSATMKASLLKVFSDKCIGSDVVSFLKKKAASFIKDRTASLLSGATVQSNLDLQQHRGEDLDDDSLHVQLPVEGASGSVPNVLLPSRLNTIGLDELAKVQQHKSSLPLHLVLTMMTALILGAMFKLYGISKSMFALQGSLDVSRQSPRYSLRKNKKASTRLVQIVMLSIIILSNVATTLSSAYALDIEENVSGDNLGEMSSDKYEKVKTEEQQGENLIDAVVSSIGHVFPLCHSNILF